MLRNEPIACPHAPDRKLPLAAGAFTSLCIAIHEFNTQWWLDPATGKPKDRNVGEMIALMHSELSEALEAHRKNLMDDKLPHFHGIDVELVDCIIRAMDLLGARHKARQDHLTKLKPRDDSGSVYTPSDFVAYTPGDVLYDKCHYNARRADHKPSSRLDVHGKKY